MVKDELVVVVLKPTFMVFRHAVPALDIVARVSQACLQVGKSYGDRECNIVREQYAQTCYLLVLRTVHTARLERQCSFGTIAQPHRCSPSTIANSEPH